MADDGVVFHARKQPCVRSRIGDTCHKARRAGGKRGYSLAHAKHSVNLGDTQPMKDIGHQGLEAHVLYTGNVFGALEIVRCKICPALSRVVHNYRWFSVSLSLKNSSTQENVSIV